MFAAAGLIFSAPAHAGNGQQEKVYFGWRGADGKPSAARERQEVEADWIWRQESPELPQGGPALRLIVLFPVPEGWSFALVTGVQAEVRRLMDGAVDAEKKVVRLQVDLLSTQAQVMVRLVNVRGKLRQVVLDLSVPIMEPVLRMDPQCANYEWELQTVTLTKGSSKSASVPVLKPLFLGLACRSEKKDMIVYVVKGPDFRWSPEEAQVQEPTGELRLLSSVPQKDGPKPPPFKLKLVDAKERPQSYLLKINHQGARKPWGIAFGFAGTSFAYSEALQNLELRQGGVTAKASFSYQLIPNKLSLDTSVFGTLFAFNVSPVERPPLFTLGANGRVGYRLPVDWLGIDWTILGGFYYWTSVVRDESYGVDSLSGPQLFVTFSSSQPRSLPFFLYGKFATISDFSEFFNIRNHEVAVGGGIGLWPSPTALMLTVDLAHTQFFRGLNSMVLGTLSVGLLQRF